MIVRLIGRDFPISWLQTLTSQGDVHCHEGEARASGAVDVFVILASAVDIPDTLEQIMIRASGPRPAVILADGVTTSQKGAWLSNGAVAVLEGALDDPAEAAQHAAVIRSAAAVTAVYHARRRVATTPTRLRRPHRPPQVPAVAVASSTGGPQALEALLSELPADYPAAVLVAQHMGETFIPLLIETIQRHCRLPLVEAAGGERLAAGTVYVSPGDQHMVVRGGGVLRLVPPNGEHHVPSADHLLTSVAEVYGSAALGVVLSGIGNDGCAGAVAIHAMGGAVYIQAEETCAVWGMPKAVSEAGVARQALSPTELGALLAGHFSRGQP
jgi:two-component system chemotaxis response regulator CheB